MKKNKKIKNVLRSLNYDLFQQQQYKVLPSATIDPDMLKQKTIPSHIDINPQEGSPVTEITKFINTETKKLPSIRELYRLFNLFNLLYFGGKLPPVKIEYSTRMSAAGSYTPERKLIRIGSKYHELFPMDIEDTLKHEMIHIIHFRHDTKFKKEAIRIGCSVKAKYHQSLRRIPKYLYYCPSCNCEFPRQKRFRMASCGYCSKGGKYDERFKLRLKK
jgi:predicted SprT family Zn-dependent metalloprotease